MCAQSSQREREREREQVGKIRTILGPGIKKRTHAHTHVRHTRPATSYLRVPRSSSLLIPYRIYRNNLFRRICHKIYPTRTTPRHRAHAKRTHSHVRASRAGRALLIRIRTRDSVCKLRYPVVTIVSRGQ